jgi:hypothetical protein
VIYGKELGYGHRGGRNPLTISPDCRLGDYQMRNLQAIQRHVALVLLSYFTLILLKILQWQKDKRISLDLSIRTLALQVRSQILIERITIKLKNLKIQFKQNILDSYLEQLCA